MARGFSVVPNCTELYRTVPAARDTIERAQQSPKSGEWFCLVTMAGEGQKKF